MDQQQEVTEEKDHCRSLRMENPGTPTGRQACSSCFCASMPAQLSASPMAAMVFSLYYQYAIFFIVEKSNNLKK